MYKLISIWPYCMIGTLLSHTVVHSVLFSAYEAIKLMGMSMIEPLLDDLKYKDHDDVSTRNNDKENSGSDNRRYRNNDDDSDSKCDDKNVANDGNSDGE